ncbi:unnamed protein product [Ixodes pacificus]
MAGRGAAARTLCVCKIVQTAARASSPTCVIATPDFTGPSVTKVGRKSGPRPSRESCLRCRATTGCLDTSIFSRFVHCTGGSSWGCYAPLHRTGIST